MTLDVHTTSELGYISASAKRNQPSRQAISLTAAAVSRSVTKAPSSSHSKISTSTPRPHQSCADSDHEPVTEASRSAALYMNDAFEVPSNKLIRIAITYPANPACSCLAAAKAVTKIVTDVHAISRLNSIGCQQPPFAALAVSAKHLFQTDKRRLVFPSLRCRRPTTNWP